MKARIQDDILSICHEDLPPYRRGGSVVRNTFFWALKAIACHAPREGDWEFDEVVWIALTRILLSFALSGYLGYSETCLEFSEEDVIPESLRSVATYI